MDDLKFQDQVDSTDNFQLRQAVERLREGLFDPLAVQWLTSGVAKLNRSLDRSAAQLDRGESSHLCICGAYGQGKSHSLTYIKQRALADDFVVSYINLDPRQVPFHNFKAVYRALMSAMEFPDGESSFVKVWKEYAQNWLAQPENNPENLFDIIPREIPHRFRAILAAMALKNIDIPANKRKFKKHARYKPREFSWILKNALLGKDIPVWKLRAVFHYRQVPFYKDHSLVCHNSSQFLALVKGMAALVKTMGFKGWVVLFDEGESIGQTRITSRSTSYALLHTLFCPKEKNGGLYPVFAFTHDFFDLVSQEAYDRTRIVKGRVNGNQPPREFPLFKRNYHEAWEKINVYTLQDLSSAQWRKLIRKLMILHGRAYGWSPHAPGMEHEMEQVLSGHAVAEPRMKLRFLVNHLDLEQQKLMI